MKCGVRKGKGERGENGKGKDRRCNLNRDFFFLVFLFSLFPLFPFLHSLQFQTAKMLLRL
jgi:hypothetical protein